MAEPLGGQPGKAKKLNEIVTEPWTHARFIRIYFPGKEGGSIILKIKKSVQTTLT